ncbi:MAG: hypothetical protein JNL21_19770 [Myxococcales bacterium]|nr:hypothetical protein [Myxococcales bacterium]
MSVTLAALGLTALGFLLVVRRFVPAGRVDLTPLVYLRAPLNQIAFWLRSSRNPSRRPPRVVDEPKDDLFGYLEDDREALEATIRARDLERRFDLQALRRASTREVYRHNLYVLDLLDKHLTPYVGVTADSLRAVDAGCQDFRYATALERWLKHTGTLVPRQVELDGIEVDGQGIYEDRSTRASHGEHHAALTGNPRVRYRVEDFCKAKDRGLDLVFAWFPFVLPYALVQWGLPLKLFAPHLFFQRAADALARDGVLVVVTHTDEERAALAELLAGIDSLKIVESVSAQSKLIHYWDDVTERAITIAQKRG